MEMDESKGPSDGDVKDTPSSSRDLKPVPEAAVGNFIAGKRHMLVHDYKFAVQNLATACEMYADHYGELALECGEVYFLYGKALFRLSQQQSGVLGDALNEGSNEEESGNTSGEESKENESEKNSDGEGNEENDPDKASEKETSESTDSPHHIIDENSGETKEVSETSKDETAKNVEENNIEAKEAAEDNEDNEEGEDEESGEKEGKEAEEDRVSEEDDLELAWNTLETAKQIFKRQDDISCQLKVAEILQLLAEISMESDNNQAAITDLKECLSIQQKHLKPDDRILAETYYQMGLAQMLDKMYTDAQENFAKTMQILELRIVNLRNSKTTDEKDSFKNADIDNEIQDLESILGDIKEKIEDTEELVRNTKKELEEAFTKGVQEIQAVSSSSQGSSKPVSNITHLLKRKKPDDMESEGEAKRIKITSNVPNGAEMTVEPVSSSDKA